MWMKIFKNFIKRTFTLEEGIRKFTSYSCYQKKNLYLNKMQGNENVIEFSFDIEPFQLDSDITYISSEVQYSQNYIDILGDIVEPLPL